MIDDYRHKESPIAVSVIMLSYNHADTVARALDSILAQQCDFPIEIVAGDDASTDGTREILDRYAMLYPGVVRVIPEAPRRGLVDNYFFVLSQCRGRFIADCAADDYWINSHALQLKFDRLVADPTLSMVCSDWRTFCDEENQNSQTPCSGDPDKICFQRLNGKRLLADELSCVKGTVVHLSTALYRRSIVDEALLTAPEMIHDSAMGCEDLPIKAALMSHGDVDWLSVETLCYRIGHASVSSPENAEAVVKFQLMTANAVARLADYYDVPLTAVNNNLKDKVKYAMSVAFAARDYNGVNEAENLRRQLSLKLGFKHRVMAIYSRMRMRK